MTVRFYSPDQLSMIVETFEEHGPLPRFGRQRLRARVEFIALGFDIARHKKHLLPPSTVAKKLQEIETATSRLMGHIADLGCASHVLDRAMSELRGKDLDWIGPAVSVDHVAEFAKLLHEAARQELKERPKVAGKRGGPTREPDDAKDYLIGSLIGAFAELRRRYPTTGRAVGIRRTASGEYHGPLTGFLNACLCPLRDIAPELVELQPSTVYDRWEEWRKKHPRPLRK